MPARYRFDPGSSRFTVQAFATGMLSMLGHSPTFVVRDYSGAIHLDGPGIEGLGVEVTVRADSLELLDQVSPHDRAEIETRMRRDELEPAAFPEINFQTVEYEVERSDDHGRYQVFLGGRLTLHGVTERQGIEAELTIEHDHVRLRGGCTVRMSAYRIRPVTALAGSIKLKDEIQVSFDLVARPEHS